MTTSIQQKQATKNLQKQGKHELSTELFLRGYDISTPQQKGIDLYATHAPGHMVRGLHVETSPSMSNSVGEMGEYTLSKSLVLDATGPDLWFAFVLVRSESFRFVMVPREEMVRFLQRQEERLRPIETENFSFQLFFEGRGRVSSGGYSLTPFLGLQASFPAVCRAA
jgi:hypothetical protein